MRSWVGGWVEKSLAQCSRAAVARACLGERVVDVHATPEPAATAIGRCVAITSIFCERTAPTGRPSRCSSAAPRSASYSRDRETAIWISEARDRGEDRHGEHRDRVAVAAAVAATEHRREHRHLGHERDRRGDRSGDGADQDVAVLHVHQLVRHHALDLVTGQRLAAGPRSRTRPRASGRDRSRRRSAGRSVRSRRSASAGSPAWRARFDHLVELGRLLAGDRRGPSPT